MKGIIVCPKCRKVLGAELSSDYKRCPVCGHRIRLSSSKVYFKTESQRELREAIMEFTQRLMSSGEGVPDREVVRREKQSRRVCDEIALDFIVSKLTLEKGDFDADDLMEALGDREKEEVVLLIQKMLSAGMIYEPSPGRYRKT